MAAVWLVDCGFVSSGLDLSSWRCSVSSGRIDGASLFIALNALRHADTASPRAVQATFGNKRTFASWRVVLRSEARALD
jgi:hypothetical protein